jgi:hypothetical protein
MAKKTQVLITIVDDFDGQELSEDQAHEVLFGWQNVSYRMDLSKANADKLEKLLKPYIEHAERLHGGRGRPRGAGGSKRADTGSGRPKEELQAIRDWAVKNGHEVSPRGRIKADILEAFDKAHESGASFSDSSTS